MSAPSNALIEATIVERSVRAYCIENRARVAAMLKDFLKKEVFTMNEMAYIFALVSLVGVDVKYFMSIHKSVLTDDDQIESIDRLYRDIMKIKVGFEHLDFPAKKIRPLLQSLVREVESMGLKKGFGELRVMKQVLQNSRF